MKNSPLSLAFVLIMVAVPMVFFTTKKLKESGNPRHKILGKWNWGMNESGTLIFFANGWALWHNDNKGLNERLRYKWIDDKHVEFIHPPNAVSSHSRSEVCELTFTSRKTMQLKESVSKTIHYCRYFACD